MSNGLEDVRLRYSVRPMELRIVCGAGGPSDPGILVEFGDDGVGVKVYNPKEHDPTANKLTGWSWLVPPTHSDADPETRIVDTPTPEGCPGVVVGWRGGGKSVVHPPGVDCPVHPWRTSYGSDADPSGVEWKKAARTLDDYLSPAVGTEMVKARQALVDLCAEIRRLRRTEDAGEGVGGE